MSSHRLDPAAAAAETFWRPLAVRAQWDTTAAAQLLGLSQRQLERLCQRDLGCSPRAYFQGERMATAARLLASGRLVKAVALELGYTLSANFSRDFKRHHGRPPRLFAPRPRLGLPPSQPNPVL
ncbi:MAG: hypothetical protein RL514_4364 [Verrucomicrobiota bacterium]|jgi:AraC-like DNA-binding protein